MKINYKYAMIGFTLWFSSVIPISLFLCFTDTFQKKLSGIKDIQFFYGITNPLPGMIMVFGSIFFGIALGLSIYLFFKIYRPGYREYEEELNLASKLPETVAISFNPYIKVPTRWFEIPKRYEKKLLRVFIFTAMILGIAIYLSLYDYTAANDSKIYERYYFTKKTYTWQNINSAELEFKYYQPRQSDDTPEWRYSIELVLFKEGKKIYIWKDNGLANPTKEEIVWLLEKLKKENIPVVFAPVPTNTLQGLYQTNNDFRNRIYPALNSLITFTED